MGGKGSNDTGGTGGDDENNPPGPGITFSWDETEFQAYEIGLKPWELWELSFAEFYDMHHAYWLNHSREIDQTRFLAYFLNSFVSKEHKTPQKLWPLPLLDKTNAAKSKARWKVDPEEIKRFEEWLKKQNDPGD